MWIRIKEAFDIRNGFTPLRSEERFWNNGTINWFTVDDIHKQGKYITSTIQKINECACSPDRIVPSNSLLLCCTASIGEYALTKIKLTTNQQFNALTLKYREKIFNMEFLLSVAGCFKKILLELAGVTTFPFVSTKKLGEILIPVPPLNEQQRIVDKITLFEPLLQEYDKYERKLTELESTFADKLKKSILQYAIEGKLVKQDPNDEPASVLLKRIKAEKERLIKEGKIKRDKNESYIYQGDDKNYYENNVKNGKKIDVSNHTYTIPDNWCWCSLSQLCKQITDGTHQTPKYQKDGMPFLSIANISSGFYDNKPKYISCEEHNQLIKRCNPTKNDILMCRIGTLGKPFINDLDFEFSIFVSLALIKPININMSQYLKYVLEAPNTLSYIDFVKVGGGTHTFKINIEDLNTFPIPMPPLNEQNKINKKIKIIFDQINSLLN